MRDTLKLRSSSFSHADKKKKVSIDKSNDEITPTLMAQYENGSVTNINTREKKRATHLSQKPMDVAFSFKSDEKSYD